MTSNPVRPHPIGGLLIVAAAIALVAPFTVLAWPFAIATGIVIGTSEVEKAHGMSTALGARLVRIAAVTGGVLAMLVAGVVIGGLIALVVAALARFAEHLAGDASPPDRILARITLFIGGALGWIILGTVLGLHLTVHLGV
jgi:hypothetical protein